MPELPPAEVARLVALYLRDRARWGAAPKAAQTRTRLARVHRLALETSEALAELHSIDCQLAGAEASGPVAALERALRGAVRRQRRLDRSTIAA